MKRRGSEKFPLNFVTASMQWVRSWFITYDPVTENVIEFWPTFIDLSGLAFQKKIRNLVKKASSWQLLEPFTYTG